ncbi:hypothetical protein HYX17_00745 [Candidatus Woesearchaeota archaeon]|nr:hypothetical protein [Candidatus Woesearchaeota archaeon]
MAFWRRKNSQERLTEYRLRNERWKYWTSWVPPRRREEKQPAQQPVQLTAQQPQQTYIRQRKGIRLGVVLIFFIVIFSLYLSCSFIPVISGSCDVARASVSAKFGQSYTIIKDAFIRELPRAIKYPEEAFAWTNPTVVPEKPTEKRGVIITKFEPELKFFTEEEDIRTIGIIDIKNIRGSLKLDISCSAEDYKGDIGVELIAENQNAKNSISTIMEGSVEGITQQLQVRCTIPKGSLLVDNKKSDDKTITQKLRTGKKVTLNVDYDVLATTILDLYVADPEQRVRYGFGAPLFLRNNLDVVKSGLWKGDGEIRSQQIGAKVPIPPSIELVGKQPLTKENRDIRVGLLNTLNYRLEWGGELKELKYLDVVPLGVRDDITINEERCPGFNGNRLSSKLIKQINDGIANYCYSDIKNEEECINFRDNLLFSCGIKVNTAPEGDLLDVYELSTNVIYTYRVTKDSSVQIRKVENPLFVNVEKNLNEVTTSAIFFTENLLKKLPYN